MRKLLTLKNAGDAAFWVGCLAVALILFFVVYDNDDLRRALGTLRAVRLDQPDVDARDRDGRPLLVRDRRSRRRRRVPRRATSRAARRRARTSRAPGRSTSCFMLLAAAAVGAAPRGDHRGSHDPSARGVLRPLHDRPRRGRRGRSSRQQSFLGQHQGLAGASRFLEEDQIATENGRTIHFFIGLALIAFCPDRVQARRQRQARPAPADGARERGRGEGARRRRRPGAVRRLHHLVGGARPDRRLLHRLLRRRLARPSSTSTRSCCSSP